MRFFFSMEKEIIQYNVFPTKKEKFSSTDAYVALERGVTKQIKISN